MPQIYRSIQGRLYLPYLTLTFRGSSIGSPAMSPSGRCSTPNAKGKYQGAIHPILARGEPSPERISPIQLSFHSRPSKRTCDLNHTFCRLSTDLIDVKSPRESYWNLCVERCDIVIQDCISISSLKMSRSYPDPVLKHMGQLPTNASLT